MKISSFFLIIYLALSFSAEADHLERMQERTGIPDPTGIYHIGEHAISSYDSGNLKGAFETMDSRVKHNYKKIIVQGARD